MSRNWWVFGKIQILQYFLIYLVFISSRAVIYATYQMNWVYATMILCAFLSMKYTWLRNQKIYIVFAFLLASLQLTRMINHGGYGLEFWLINVSKIWVAYIAVNIDKNNFLERFLRMTVFFASISLIMWILSFIAPGIVEQILFAQGEYFGGTKGMLLYTFRYSTWSRGDTRNVGIFTEPGIYQIVLNVAIYILLFMRSKLNFSAKKTTRYLLVLIAALLSCQSTTGYISLAIIVLGFLLQREKSDVKMRILQLLVLGIVILLVNYSISGTNSIVYKTIISKLSTEGGQFDLNASTGYYRMNGITAGLEIFYNNPLGAGDYYIGSLQNILTGTVASGAGIITVLATCGIITFLMFSYFNIYLAARNIKSIIPFMVYLSVWINTGLSQSDIVYAVMLCIVFSGLESVKKHNYHIANC